MVLLVGLRYRRVWDVRRAADACCDGVEIEWVIVRPPLVYGVGVRGNFARLLELINASFLQFGRQQIIFCHS
jgi:nucleoside-diphosphate-sugar epimerase